MLANPFLIPRVLSYSSEQSQTLVHSHNIVLNHLSTQLDGSSKEVTLVGSGQ